MPRSSLGLVILLLGSCGGRNPTVPSDVGVEHERPADLQRAADRATLDRADLGFAEPSPGTQVFADTAVVCGDGSHDIGEACDDGNLESGDGCSSNCEVEAAFRCYSAPFDVSICVLRTCGDFFLDSDLGHECDDGDTVPGDGCDAACLLEDGFVCRQIVSPEGFPRDRTSCEPLGCGDGVVVHGGASGEQCDDGNASSGDGCSELCAVEPGFACADVQILSTFDFRSDCRAAGCGNTIPEAGEECDDGDDNSDALADSCRADCTLPRCGDLVEDSAELCDNGSFNGQAGFCTSTCDGYLPRLVTGTHSYEAEALPSVVGLFLSEADLMPVCAESPVDLDRFDDILEFVATHDFFVGRIVQADVDFTVEHPIIFLDDGIAPRGGGSIFSAQSASVVPSFGRYSVAAGTPVLVPIFGGAAGPSCPCGTGGGAQIQGCNAADPPAPAPCVDECPDFDPSRAFTIGLDASVPASPVGTHPENFSASCSATCLIAGSLTSCDEPGVGAGPAVPVDVVEPCPASPGRGLENRICGELSPELGVVGCPGMCETPDGTCAFLGASEGVDVDEVKCQLMGDGVSMCTSDECECTTTRGADDLIDVIGSLREVLELTPDQLLLYCTAHRGEPGCPFDTEDLLSPPEGEPDVPRCGEDNPTECLMCSPRLGNGCLPFQDNRDRVVDRFLRAVDPWPGPTVAEADPRERGGASSELKLRWFDPRRAELGTPGANTPDPISLASGELLIDTTDVSFPSRGVSFSFERSYRSGARRSGALGPGWSHKFEERIEPIGDPDNRQFAPSYCVNKLPIVRCLLHHDGRGGTSMYVFDGKSGLFLPPPGVFGVIRAQFDEEGFLVGSERGPSKLPVMLLTEPGGVTRRFDSSGVLLSVADEMGYGLELSWRIKTLEEAELDGAWTGALSTTTNPVDPRSLAAGIAQRARMNRLNRLELDEVTDSYGRKIQFEYTTFGSTGSVPAGGPYRHRRLSGLTFRDEQLVSFGYTELAQTGDAYLTSVERRGMQGSFAATPPIVVAYEYAHDLVTNAFAIPPDGDAPSSGLGIEIDETVRSVAEAFALCAGSLHREIGASGPTCGTPFIPAGADTSRYTAVAVWRRIQEELADNIIRVSRAGEVELEVFYEPDPRKRDFDRAVEQRYGVLPAKRSEPEPVIRSGVTVHEWQTDMPKMVLRQTTYGAAPFQGLDVDVVPHDPFEPTAGSDLPSECDALEDLDDLAFFASQSPVGPREDINLNASPTVRRTNASCPSIAARHSRDAFLNDLIELPAASVGAGEGRERLAWDLNLVCRWVEQQDRMGIKRLSGLNFQGEVLVAAEPSPTGNGLAVTIRRVNADGLIVEETQPDKGVTEVVYGGRASPFAFEERDFVPGDALRRQLPEVIIERPAPTLPAPVDLDGNVVAERRWTLAYDPAFQRLVSTVSPDLVITRSYLDYQQSGPLDNDAVRLKSRIYSRTSTEIDDAAFRDQDLDGDGIRPGEVSAGVVLTVTEDVDLGGGNRGDVGTRSTRDDSGRVREERRIAAAFDPALDFDYVEVRYYEDLAKAEAGDLGGDDCDAPQGPLGRVRRLRSASSSAPSDRVQEFMVYDALGGVRLRESNDDVETRIITERNALGLVAREESPGPLVSTFTYDSKGQVAREVHRDAADSTVAPRITLHAWGLQGLILGSCTEIVFDACRPFEAYALSVLAMTRDGSALLEPLPDATWAIALFDEEDRDAGSVDAGGGTTIRLRSAAGVVVEETVAGSPPLTTTWGYDAMGRVVSTTTGVGGERIERFAEHDGLGRQIAAQSLSPLGQGAFTNGAGTIARTRFDKLDRPLLRFVEGDDGDGARKVLSITHVERNEVGSERFVHRAAGALASSLPVMPSGFSVNDHFATEELRYDHALRPVFHRAEGQSAASAAEYDGLGLRELDALHSSVEIVLNPAARTNIVTRLSVAEGVGAAARTLVDTRRFDGRGLLVERTLTDDENGVPRMSTSSYDGLGQLRQSRDAAGRVVQFLRDRAGRVTVTLELSPDGDVERTSEADYDLMGRVVAERPAVDAPPTFTSYDVAGRTIERESGASGGAYRQHVGYDSAGRVVDRATNARRSRSTALTFRPNASRPRTLRVDGFLAKTFDRDGLERVVGAIDENLVLSADAAPSSNASRRPLSTLITYDSLGRVINDATVSRTDGAVLTDLVRTWPENYLGPESIETLAGSTLDYDYTSRGTLRRIQRQGLDANSNGNGSGNNGNGSGNGNGNSDVDIHFSSEGGLWVRASVGPRWTVEKRRDAFGFVTGNSLRSSDIAAGLSADDVLRGPTGKIVAERTSGRRFAASVRGYGYDGLGRFARLRTDVETSVSAIAFVAQVNAALLDESAGLSAPVDVDAVVVANLTDADVIASVTVDEHHREYAATADATAAGVPPTVVNGRSITRDALDRTQTDSSLQYTFDAFDRLVRVREGGRDELQLSYDGLGRRRLERRRMNDHTEDAVLEYDGANVIEETDVESGELFVGTTHAPGIDAPLAVTTENGTFVLRTNSRGDVVAAALETGTTITEEQLLDPWGEREMRFRSPAAPCVEGNEGRIGSRRVSLPRGRCAVRAEVLGRFGLGGARSHPSTKLVDLRNRVYAPHLRTFLTRDPLGNVDSDGLWAYVAGDPINLRDPWGLSTNSDDPAPDDSGCGKFAPGTQCPVQSAPDAAPAAPARMEQPLADDERCDMSCRQRRQWAKDVEYRNYEDRRAAGEQRIEAQRIRRENDDRGLLDVLSDGWHGLIDALSPGERIVNLSIGMHHHHGGGGYMAPPEIMKRAHDTTEVLAPMVLGPLAKTGATVLGDLTALSRAAAAADRGAFTRAGRQFQSHSMRPGTSFPSSRGLSHVQMNQVGLELVDDILTTPGTVSTIRTGTLYTTRYGGEVTDFISPSGRGVRFGSTGEFIGFLEPP